MPKYTHLHRYKKKDISAFDRAPYFVFQCQVPGCTHYLRKNLADGAMCECPSCGEPMLLDSRNMKLVTPICEVCRVKRKKEMWF